mgnify:CR=1 FL=1
MAVMVIAPLSQSRADDDYSIASAQGFGTCCSWFSNTQAGWFFPQDLNFTPRGFAGNHIADFKSGWGTQLDLLAAVNPALAVGLTIGYFQAQMNALTTAAGVIAPASGDLVMAPLMLTAIYHRQVFNRLSFFAGVSWGLMHYRFDISAPTVALNRYTQSQWNFAAGLRAGIAIRLMQNLSFIATYEFMKGFSSEGYSGHAILLGFSTPWCWDE